MAHKKELVQHLLEYQILVTPAILSIIPDFFPKERIILYVQNYLDHLVTGPSTVQLQVQESALIQPAPFQPGTVQIIKNYTKDVKKSDVQSFVQYFRRRYDALKALLEVRLELQNSISISRVQKKGEGEHVSIIGLVYKKNYTKNGNIMLQIEDPSGTTKVLVTKTKEELFTAANDLVLDEVVGITGMTGKDIIFCNNLSFPEIPLSHELKKAPDEVYAAFVSDIHFGIKNFLHDEFIKFIQWLSGDFGSAQQRDIAKKIKYLFVTGDIVEGAGIYPGQDQDLAILDIKEQYEEAARYFRKIPTHIKIIICGGNHDAIRISEPQPPFDTKTAAALYTLPNMIFVSNPATVNIHSSSTFPGFNVLMYHGYSIPFIAAEVPSIRAKGGQDRVDLIMQFLLQRRHLAPSHGSSMYIPDTEEDPLVISSVPDIFVTGHIHRIVASNYRNVTIINSSCWVTQSENQAKRGIVPHPARIPLVNLHTREIKVMNFNTE